MNATRTNMRTRLAAGVLAALVASPGAFAAPFAISYTGTVDAGSTIPQAVPGQTYTVTFVMDNGTAGAANQAWVAADLRCAFWAVGSAAFAQNLLATPATTVTGSATTDAGGVLTANFTEVTGDPGAGSSLGFVPALTPPVSWFANAVNEVFYDTAFARAYGDAAGGVQMGPASWSNPQPFNAACTAANAPGLAAAAGGAIPTVSEWGLAILSALLAFAGLVTLRRRL
jgi:hypothetical protein